MLVSPSPAVPDPHLRVEGVGVQYERGGRLVAAVRDVTFAVHAGEFVSLVGPSGCGKTTLLLALGGLLRATSGTIWCAGRQVAAPGPERVVVFQEFSLFKWRTAAGNVSFALECRRVPPPQRAKIVRDLLRKVGLDGFADAFPFQLSGGMKQRVAIARALAYDPEVLLMDEPFAALDAQTRLAMQALLLAIWDELHKTVVFVTHDIDEAIFLADRVLIMSARPGTIKREVLVAAPRPRPLAYLLSPGFLEVKRQVFQAIQEEAGGTTIGQAHETHPGSAYGGR